MYSLSFFFLLFIQGLSVCFFVLGWPCTVDRTLKSKFDQSQNTFRGLGVSGHGNTLTMAFCRRQWVKSLKLCEYDNFVCTSPPPVTLFWWRCSDFKAALLGNCAFENCLKLLIRLSLMRLSHTLTLWSTDCFYMSRVARDWFRMKVYCCCCCFLMQDGW